MYTSHYLPELNLRYTKIREAMRQTGADACLVSTSVNLFYTSGRVFNGFTYIPEKGNVLYFVKRPVGLKGEGIIYIRKPEQIAEYLGQHNLPLPQTLLLETDTISYNECERLKAIFSPGQIGNASQLMREVRSIKTPYEIELIRESGIKHDAVYRRIPSVYEEGMSDTEFSIELERLTRLEGSLGIFRVFGSSMEIYMGSVIAGDNADKPSPYDFAMGGEGLDSSIPVGCNGTLIRPGMTVMVDMGGNFTGYMTDMTRTFTVGDVSDLAQKAHQTSILIQKEIEKKAKPGTATADLYNLAVEIAAQAGLQAYFMGHKQQAGFIGHGVGIEINEAPVLAPRSKEILQEGMVFALEPKFVIPHVGAVGIENTFLVTKDGVEKLTRCEEALTSLI